MTRSSRFLATVALVLGLSPALARAQTASPPAAPAPARDWAFSASGVDYIFPGEDDLLVGVVTADRGALHLETRYNYEGRDIGSVWGGWNWSTGKKVTFNITAMLAAVFGDIDGVAPGCRLGLGWKRFDYYLESEVVLPSTHDVDNYVYAWSEIGWKPVDWMRVGLVAERSRTVENGLSVQRGVLAQAIVGRWTFGVNWFNPLDDAHYTVVAAAVKF
jgi:hypothetical protein